MGSSKLTSVRLGTATSSSPISSSVWGLGLPISSKVLLGILFTLTIYSTLVSGYLGPRYGKRIASDGEVSGAVMGRTGGLRTIQSRSQAKFYAGSRYGGKRSGYHPSMMPSGPSDMMMGGPSENHGYPYDCVYIPYVGVRYAVLRSGGGGSDEAPDSENQGSYGFTRTSIIDTPSSASSSSSQGSGSD